MNSMAVKLCEHLKKAGYEAATISISHLEEAQAAIARLVGQGLVSRKLSANWRFYLKGNDDFPAARTIVVIAIPQPVVRVIFRWQGKERAAEMAPGYFYRTEEARAEESLKNVLAPAGYRTKKAFLPLKTLAVRGGLAEYGRNNIAYVTGMGSFFRLVAFYTDCPCENDVWVTYRVMTACDDCSLCRQNCPTGCIGTERFLIHAENCLGFLGQKQPDFPFWVRLQPDWPGGIVGCMSCQFICPVNEPYIGNVRDGPVFSENETGLLMEAVPLDNLPPETRHKLSDMAEPVYPLLSRNLREFLAKQYISSGNHSLKVNKNRKHLT